MQHQRATVTLSLTPEGRLQMELPGSVGPRLIPVAAGKAEEILIRMLEAQAVSRISIGEDGAPTKAQVKHWSDHQILPDSRCPFCRFEGRIVGPSGRQQSKFASVTKLPSGVEVRRYASGHKPSAKAAAKPKTALATSAPSLKLGDLF